MVNDRSSLLIESVQLKNFRCFKEKQVEIQQPLVLLEGANGSGKSSLLEALYYACYLRSFRTHSPRELALLGEDAFFVRLSMSIAHAGTTLSHQIQVGYQQGRRVVKVDNAAISSYKELIDHVRIVSVAEDDLEFVKGAPQARRTAIDQALILHDSTYIDLMAKLKQTVANRNALIMRQQRNALYSFLTEQILEQSAAVRKERVRWLALVQDEVNTLLEQTFQKALTVSFDYKNAAGEKHSADDLWARELRLGRSLIGAQIDDIAILFQDRSSRIFASRGEQKLVLILFKIAQMKLLSKSGRGAIFVLDDFLTDLDEGRARLLFDVIASLDGHVVLSAPVVGGFLSDLVSLRGGQIVQLS